MLGGSSVQEYSKGMLLVPYAKQYLYYTVTTVQVGYCIPVLYEYKYGIGYIMVLLHACKDTVVLSQTIKLLSSSLSYKSVESPLTDLLLLL